MIKMRFAVVFLVVVSMAHVELKKFTRCELARELVRQGLHRVGPLNDWVCLIENESARNTKAMNTNSNKSKDWGLFQINDKYWCTSGKPGKDCNVKCEDLLLNDITKATKCATIIYRRHKFSAWVGWKNRCQKNLPNIAKECKINLG